MPVLKNARHERFAQGVAAGKTHASAYIDAGYSAVGADPNSSRLIRNDKIIARVAELQEKTAKRAEITLEGLLEEANDLQNRAADAQQYAAANSALKLKAELSGHYVQRKEDVTPRRSSSEIDSRVRQLLAEADQGGVGTPAGREGAGTEGDAPLPNVPGHGTA